MLKPPQSENIIDPRHSVYRPVRPAQIHHKDTWQCINFDYSLESVLKGWTLFDLFRSALDTTTLLVLLFYINELQYEEVMLVKPTPDQDYDEATTFTSIARREYERNYNNTKGTLCMVMGVTSFIIFTELPLAIFLFKAVQNQDRPKMVMWTQTSFLLICFNFVGFSTILVYSSKAGLILDDETWITEQGTNVEYLVYMQLLRAAIFDLVKGIEIICVNSFSKEIAKRNKVIALGAAKRSSI